MLVREWMSHPVECIDPEEDVATARERLRTRRVRQLPVVVASGALVGIVTDRDLRAARDAAVPVASVMTPHPVTTTPAALVEDAAAVLRERGVGALPVVENEQVVGIISKRDLLAALVTLCGTVQSTTLLEVECDAGAEAVGRLRHTLEAKGAQIPWLQVTQEGSGQLVALRVRTPIGMVPAEILEEAGFSVLASVGGPGSTAAQRAAEIFTAAHPAAGRRPGNH